MAAYYGNFFCVSDRVRIDVSVHFILARYQLENNNHQYAPSDDEDGAHQ